LRKEPERPEGDRLFVHAYGAGTIHPFTLFGLIGDGSTARQLEPRGVEVMGCVAAVDSGDFTKGGGKSTNLSADSIPQLIEKSLRRDQIGGAEALREAVVDWLKAGDGLDRAALIAQQAGKARGRAQFPG
jgi:hypothetical protein